MSAPAARECIIRARVTQADRDAAREQARLEDMSLSAFVRRALRRELAATVIKRGRARGS